RSLPVGTSAGTVAAGNDSRFTTYTAGNGLALSGSTFSFSPSAALTMNSQRLTNLAAPVSGADAATKTYVDASSTGSSNYIQNSPGSPQVATMNITGAATASSFTGSGSGLTGLS